MLEAQRRYGRLHIGANGSSLSYPDDPEREAVLVRLAWLYVDTGDYRQAVATLGKIPPESPRTSRRDP